MEEKVEQNKSTESEKQGVEEEKVVSEKKAVSEPSTVSEYWKVVQERFLMIVNPMSRKGSDLAQRMRSLLRRDGLVYDETSTDHPLDMGQTTEFWSRRFGGSRVVMVFGGDGATNQVVNNIMLSRSNKNVVLVPIMAGTANDFCHALGFHDADDSLEALKDIRTRTVDLLKMELNGAPPNRKYCMNSLGVGLDGDLMDINPFWRRFGVPGYFIAALLKGVKYLFTGVKLYNVEVRADGYYYRGPLIAVISANIARYGRIMNVAPGATLNDGKIWVSVARPVSSIKAIIESFSLLIGKQHLWKKVDTFQTDRIHLTFLEDVITQQDGEVFRYPRGTQVELSVEKDALTVLKPPQTNSSEKKKEAEKVPDQEVE